jgi:hypothetical protein
VTCETGLHLAPKVPNLSVIPLSWKIEMISDCETVDDVMKPMRLASALCFFISLVTECAVTIRSLSQEVSE